MKRSRASLMLFMATLVFALHAVRPASSPRAATADVGPLTRLCTADWSPLGDCHSIASGSSTTLAANNIPLADSATRDACHPEALPCSYQSHADYVHGVDCYGSPSAALCSHEYEDAPPIEEFVYGDPTAVSTEAVAAQAPPAVDAQEEGLDICADGFDCSIDAQPKVHCEDITAITSHEAHSAGLQTALEINAKNDGLEEAKLPSIREAVSPALAADANAAADVAGEDYVGCDYDACNYDCNYDDYSYSDCEHREHDYGDYDSGYCEHDYGCHGGLEPDVQVSSADAADADLCGAGHCSIHAQQSAAARVVSSEDEPLDLPPGETLEAPNAAEYSYDDYEYEYSDGYEPNYQDDYSYDAASDSEGSYTAEDDYGYGYNDEDLYVYEGDASEPADLPPGEQVVDDLPPGEQLIDDLPPGEQLTDDLPPGEVLPSADVTYDPYDVECYGDYADKRPAAPKAWIEPGCDEQESFTSEACYPDEVSAAAESKKEELADEEQSWGVGREYPAPPAFADNAESQELLLSTARLLNNMGQALVKLSKSLGERAGNDLDEQPAIALPAEALYPWPATLGRHQEIDAPLGL